MNFLMRFMWNNMAYIRGETVEGKRLKHWEK